MTSKAALCKALLDGKVINIKNGFQWFGVTNVPRECGRSVERAFGVKLKRIPMTGKSRYGQDCCWVNYILPKSEENLEGIKKMIEYVKEQMDGINPKTDTQAKELKKAGIDVTQKLVLPVINPLFNIQKQ